jgi:hypothetical protein
MSAGSSASAEMAASSFVIEAPLAMLGNERLTLIGAANVAAMLKSLTILARGAQALNAAWLGTACMSVEEGGAAMRARLYCATPQEWIDLERNLLTTGLNRLMRCGQMLAAMTEQILEDASIPLKRRVNAPDSLTSPTAVA